MVDDVLSFTCPRCRGDAREPFYGPCARCRSELRASVAAEARALDAGDYEPRMHVVPNQIATKD
jgi:hypothetical protein